MTACTAGDSAEHVLSSGGRAFPGVVLEISDEDGKPAPAGTEGEICHGGPGLMLGYWRDPELTVASIDDRGVSRFGDLGRVDEDGYLRVTGRIKDMIIRGGLNISAAEVARCRSSCCASRPAPWPISRPGRRRYGSTMKDCISADR